MEGGPERGSEVDFQVIGAQHYGVLVVTDSGDRGWIESEYLSASPITPQEWPPVGTRLRGLVLGVTPDGRVRICLRPVDGRPSPSRWPPPR